MWLSGAPGPKGWSWTIRSPQLTHDHPNLPTFGYSFNGNYLYWVHFFERGGAILRWEQLLIFFKFINFLDFILRNNWRITWSQRKCIHSLGQRAGLHDLAAPPSGWVHWWEEYLEGICEGASFGPFGPLWNSFKSLEHAWITILMYESSANTTCPCKKARTLSWHLCLEARKYTEFPANLETCNM